MPCTRGGTAFTSTACPMRTKKPARHVYRHRALAISTGSPNVHDPRRDRTPRANGNGAEEPRARGSVNVLQCAFPPQEPSPPPLAPSAGAASAGAASPAGASAAGVASPPLVSAAAGCSAAGASSELPQAAKPARPAAAARMSNLFLSAVFIVVSPPDGYLSAHDRPHIATWQGTRNLWRRVSLPSNRHSVRGGTSCLVGSVCELTLPPAASPVHSRALLCHTPKANGRSSGSLWALERPMSARAAARLGHPLFHSQRTSQHAGISPSGGVNTSPRRHTILRRASKLCCLAVSASFACTDAAQACRAPPALRARPTPNPHTLRPSRPRARDPTSRLASTPMRCRCRLQLSSRPQPAPRTPPRVPAWLPLTAATVRARCWRWQRA